MNIAQRLEQRRQSIERQHVWPVGWRAFRRFVYLHEQRVKAASYSGAREWFDVLRQAARCMAQATRQLQRMRHARDDMHFALADACKRAHGDTQLLVAD